MERLLQILLPKGGYAAVLEAYFDASKRDGGEFCVAGFAFGVDRAKKALRSWMKLWGDVECHMTDLHVCKNAFRDWDKDRTAQFLKDSIPIITANASFGVAVSVDVAEIERLAPKKSDPGSKQLLGGFRTPYGICCHAAMASLARMTGNSEDIAYFFESGDKHQAESQEFIAAIAAVPEISRHLFGRRSHAVIDKMDCRLMEMSDIFAWEWAKHVERVAENKPMRGSLKAILGDDLQKKGETNLGQR